jgi:hypothetical protein
MDARTKRLVPGALALLAVVLALVFREHLGPIYEVVEDHDPAITALSTAVIAAFTFTIWLTSGSQLRHARKVERAYVNAGFGGYDDGQLYANVNNYGKTPALIENISLNVLPHNGLPRRPTYSKSPPQLRILGLPYRAAAAWAHSAHGVGEVGRLVQSGLLWPCLVSRHLQSTALQQLRACARRQRSKGAHRLACTGCRQLSRILGLGTALGRFLDVTRSPRRRGRGRPRGSSARAGSRS